jgi:hypothetical protein
MSPKETYLITVVSLKSTSVSEIISGLTNIRLYNDKKLTNVVKKMPADLCNNTQREIYTLTKDVLQRLLVSMVNYLYYTDIISFCDAKNCRVKEYEFPHKCHVLLLAYACRRVEGTCVRVEAFICCNSL